jgi:uncharacterized membrane protein (DUF4010 family)
MLEVIPPLLEQFLTTTLLAFLVGLEFHHYLRERQHPYKFGSTRTCVLLALVGFVLFQLDSSGFLLVAGLICLSVLLGIYYWRQTLQNDYSLFEILIALLVFLIGPVSIHFPTWFSVLFVVILVLIVGKKPLIHQFSESLASNEIITLAKFLVICGVVLPLLPDTQILTKLPISYVQAWIAVIVVSGFSYLSYLAQTYFFKSRGLLLTGLLGGLYSSTAISVVIGRQAQAMPEDRSRVSSALIIATAMMYLRLLLILFFLDIRAGKLLLWPFAGLIVLSCITSLILIYKYKPLSSLAQSNITQHPLELSTALVFAFMFVFFAFITQYVISHFGNHGLKFL